MLIRLKVYVGVAGDGHDVVAEQLLVEEADHVVVLGRWVLRCRLRGNCGRGWNAFVMMVDVGVIIIGVIGIIIVHHVAPSWEEIGLGSERPRQHPAVILAPLMFGQHIEHVIGGDILVSSGGGRRWHQRRPSHLGRVIGHWRCGRGTAEGLNPRAWIASRLAFVPHFAAEGARPRHIFDHHHRWDALGVVRVTWTLATLADVDTVW